MLLALCEDRGIVPEALKGWDKLQPIRRSASPSIRSASSAGLPMGMLAVSETRSNTSSHSSSASKRQKRTSKHIYSYNHIHSDYDMRSRNCEC